MTFTYLLASRVQILYVKFTEITINIMGWNLLFL